MAGAHLLRNGVKHTPRISRSTASLAVAFSITSCSTLREAVSLGAALPCVAAASASPVILVCCRMAILVSSGMPGMSFSAMALSSATRGQRVDGCDSQEM